MLALFVADGVASLVSARDVRRGRISKIMYVWDWLSIGVPVVGAALACAFPTRFRDPSAFAAAILGLFAAAQTASALCRRAAARRLDRLGGVERVFD